MQQIFHILRVHQMETPHMPVVKKWPPIAQPHDPIYVIAFSMILNEYLYRFKLRCGG